MIPMGGGGHMFMWGQRGDAAKKRPTIAMYRRLLRFVGPYRWNLALAAVLLLVSTALGLVWPQIVQRVLDHLPPRYATVLEWKYVDELSVQEIASRLGLGLKAAESLLTRARRAFRDAFRATAPAWPLDSDGRTTS